MKRILIVTQLALCICVCLAAAARAQQNPIVGTWRSSYMLNGMQVVSESVYMPDGTFSSMSYSNMGYMIRITGTYSFPAPGIIQYQNKDWAPKSVTIPASESDEYQFLSPTTVRARSLIPGSQWLVAEKVQ